MVFLSLAGCNKLVDMKPLNEISDVDYWKTSDQYKLAANEFYTYLITFGNVLYDPAPNTSTGSPHADIRSDLTASSQFADAPKNSMSNSTLVSPP